jgi:hypothetical protein
MKKRSEANKNLHFPRVSIQDASNCRGKHGRIVSEILSDLTQLDEYSAIEVALDESPSKKAALRAALHRAAKKKNIALVTTSDERHLYVFRRPKAK